MTTRIIVGDALEMLKTLPDESAHCCVTSPPYWGLRDYGTAAWNGGDEACDHKQYLGGHGDASTKQVTSGGTQQYNYRDACGKCGAERTDRQVGLEPTIDEYVSNMVVVFQEVRRVLRDDGTLWLNLGDTYAGGGLGGNPSDSEFRKQATNRGSLVAPSPLSGLKPKDLCGIPWRVAFALQADGWWLRQDIIWSKPNPMPESVTDRCTKSHEYIFLLSKDARYYYDADAIAEPAKYAGSTISLGEKSLSKGQANGMNIAASGNGKSDSVVVADTRNKRSVWTVQSAAFPEAHFATFPSELIKPCVLAGCPVGGTVLDPFAGAGTTGLVADRQHRNSIMIELNAGYAEMAQRRITRDSPLFSQVTTGGDHECRGRVGPGL